MVLTMGGRGKGIYRAQKLLTKEEVNEGRIKHEV